MARPWNVFVESREPGGVRPPRNAAFNRARSGPGAIGTGAATKLPPTAEERRRWSDELLQGRAGIVHGWWSSQFDLRRLRRFGIPIEELPPQRALVRSFLLPLFELLRAWIRTGEGRYADVYLDERLRYAPHQASWVRRAQFFDEVLSLDERALVEALPDEAARSALRALLRELHASLRAPAPANPVRLLAMGDCLMNEVRVALLSRCRADAIPVDFRGLYFSALYGKGLSVEGAIALLRDFPADLVALSFLSYKGIVPYAALVREAASLRARELDRRVDAVVALLRDFLAELRARTDAPFLVHNASGLPLTPARQFLPFLPPLSRAHRELVEVLGDRVAELVASTPNALLIDEAAVSAEHGLRACMARLIPPFIAAGAEYHTARFGEYLVPQYRDVIESYRTLSRCKVLAIDFDDTLWQGVMADGAVMQRVELQQTLRRLREAGILLVATSKNDPKNIRWSEMFLKREDFVLEKVSWNLKAQSIQEAAETLGVGIDSFVLLDDSAVERDLVRSRLPQVRALDPNAPHTPRWLERMLSFPNTAQTAEARQRTELYRARSERAAALAEPLDYPAMMAGLGLRVRFGAAAPQELDRIAELVQRTNQFNTTTIRYTRQQLLDLLAGGAHVIYTAALSDKFGSMGLVAVAVVRRDGPTRVFESFVMSCRAMGFGLEQLVVRRVLDAEGGPGVQFVGRYVPTERNGPCRTLWETSGFSPIAAGGGWVLEPEAPRPEEPAWFRATGSDQRAA